VRLAAEELPRIGSGFGRGSRRQTGSEGILEREIERSQRRPGRNFHAQVERMPEKDGNGKYFP